MPQAAGIFKQVSIKREVTYGVPPGASGFQLLRRVESTLDLTKDAYQSNELRPDLQDADMRHGPRRVRGAIKGELSPGTYSDLFAIICKRDFTAGVSVAAMSMTIAGAGPTYTLTRAAGSYLADGFKVGDVVRLSVGVLNALNINKNLFVLALTATVATVLPLNSSAMFPEGPIASTTMAVFGKKTYIPLTGHTDVSVAVEHWHSDISQSELFTGIKFDKADIALPPTGMATVNFDAMGQNMTPAAVRYGTSPTPVTTTAVVAAVNGALMVNGALAAFVTGLQFSINPSFTGDPVVGSNLVPALFTGRVPVTGQFTAYFQDAVLRDLFINETESQLAVALTSDNTATAAFLACVMSRVKFMGATKNDGEGALVQTFPFKALLNLAGGAGTANEATTISVKESNA
jgi:hypothetical protein